MPLASLFSRHKREWELALRWPSGMRRTFEIGALIEGTVLHVTEVAQPASGTASRRAVVLFEADRPPPGCSTLEVAVVSMRRQGRMQGAFDSLELGDRITVFNPVLSRIIAVSGSSDASDERFAELVTLKGSIHRTPRLERNAEGMRMPPPPAGLKRWVDDWIPVLLWTPPDDVPIRDDVVSFSLLAEDHELYKSAIELGGDFGGCIKAVYKIHNRGLQANFEAACMSVPGEDTLMLHGAPPVNIAGIARNGFDVSLTDRYATAGCGAYLTTAPTTALSIAAAKRPHGARPTLPPQPGDAVPPDIPNTCQVIVARVRLGRVGHASTHGLTAQQTQSCNSVQCPVRTDTRVVPDGRRVLPLAVIYFELDDKAKKSVAQATQNGSPPRSTFYLEEPNRGGTAAVRGIGGMSLQEIVNTAESLAPAALEAVLQAAPAALPSSSHAAVLEMLRFHLSRALSERAAAAAAAAVGGQPSGGDSHTVAAVAVRTSCACKKDGCKTKRCPCKKAGVACGVRCACSDCSNTGEPHTAADAAAAHTTPMEVE